MKTGRRCEDWTRGCEHWNRGVSTGIEGVNTRLGSRVLGNRSDHDVVDLYFFFKLCVSRVWGWCEYVSVSDLPGAGGISSCDP